MRTLLRPGTALRGAILLAVLLVGIGGPAMATACSLLEACPMEAAPPCHGATAPTEETMDCCPDGRTPLEVRGAVTQTTALSLRAWLVAAPELPRVERIPSRSPERCSRSPGLSRALLCSFLL